MGAFTSSIGTWMQKMAQAWLVLEISKSPFLLGLDAFLGEIPILLFSLVGGVVADRMDRRRLLILSQVIQLSCAFLLAGLVAFDVVRIWHILTLSFLVGTAQAFGGPANQALIPSLVEPDDLPNAIAMQSIQFNLARVVGPAVGGLAFTTLGYVGCFSLNGLSYIAVIISLVLLRTKYIPKKTEEAFLASMRQGMGFIRRQSAMSGLIVLAFAMTALGIPLLTFLPVFARDVFHGGPQTYTLMLSLSGAGAVVGALVVAGFGHIRHKGRLALVLLTCTGVGIAAFSLSRLLWASCAVLFLTGVTLIGVFAMIASLAQLITGDEMRGRVMSVYNVAFRGGMSIGSLLTGWLAKMFTAPAVLAANGLVLFLVAMYYFSVERKVARL